jgi:hypothetical protein
LRRLRFDRQSARLVFGASLFSEGGKFAFAHAMAIDQEIDRGVGADSD